MTDIRNSVVLDCFAGAGSLGFEAASRGAKQVTAIEKNKQAALQLKENCQSLNAGTQIIVHQGDFFQKAKSISGQFNIIFVDPPFHANLVQPAIDLLLASNKLAENSLLYIEQEKGANFDLSTSDKADNFDLIKQKDAGQVNAQLYRYISN